MACFIKDDKDTYLNLSDIAVVYATDFGRFTVVTKGGHQIDFFDVAGHLMQVINENLVKEDFDQVTMFA